MKKRMLFAAAAVIAVIIFSNYANAVYSFAEYDGCSTGLMKKVIEQNGAVARLERFDQSKTPACISPRDNKAFIEYTLFFKYLLGLAEVRQGVNPATVGEGKDSLLKEISPGASIEVKPLKGDAFSCITQSVVEGDSSHGGRWGVELVYDPLCGACPQDTYAEFFSPTSQRTVRVHFKVDCRTDVLIVVRSLDNKPLKKASYAPELTNYLDALRHDGYSFFVADLGGKNTQNSFFYGKQLTVRGYKLYYDGSVFDTDEGAQTLGVIDWLNKKITGHQTTNGVQTQSYTIMFKTQEQIKQVFDILKDKIKPKMVVIIGGNKEIPQFIKTTKVGQTSETDVSDNFYFNNDDDWTKEDKFVFVARIPILNGDASITKTILAQVSNPALRYRKYSNKKMVIDSCGDPYGGCDIRKNGDAVANALGSIKTYSPDTCAAVIMGSGVCDPDSVKNFLSDSQFVVFTGHGAGYTLGSTNPKGEQEVVRKKDNTVSLGAHPIVVLLSCHTGEFTDDDDSRIAISLLEKGALSIIAYSGGHWDLGLQDAAIKALLSSKKNSKPIGLNLGTELVIRPTDSYYIKYNKKNLNFFGDPTLVIDQRA